MQALLIASAVLATGTVLAAQDPAKPAVRPTQSPTFPTPAGQNSAPDIERLTKGLRGGLQQG